MELINKKNIEGDTELMDYHVIYWGEKDVISKFNIISKKFNFSSCDEMNF